MKYLPALIKAILAMLVYLFLYRMPLGYYNFPRMCLFFGFGYLAYFNLVMVEQYIELTTADLAEMETEFSKIKVHGGRMNAMQMQQVQ